MGNGYGGGLAHWFAGKKNMWGVQYNFQILLKNIDKRIDQVSNVIFCFFYISFVRLKPYYLLFWILNFFRQIIQDCPVNEEMKTEIRKRGISIISKNSWKGPCMGKQGANVWVNRGPGMGQKES